MHTREAHNIGACSYLMGGMGYGWSKMHYDQQEISRASGVLQVAQLCLQGSEAE